MASILTEKQQKLLLFFREAIAAEKHAQETYTEMAELAEDDQLKKIILAFAEEEKQHEKTFREIYAKLRLQKPFNDHRDEA